MRLCMVIYGVRGDAGRDSDNFNTRSVLLRELTRESLNYFMMFRAKDSMTLYISCDGRGLTPKPSTCDSLLQEKPDCVGNRKPVVRRAERCTSSLTSSDLRGRQCIN